MQCDYFDAGTCVSCTLMGTPYDRQLADKDRDVRATLLDVTARTHWHPPFPSAESAFRNKAKMAVGGTADRATLGLLDRSGQGIDLQSCGLYEPAIIASFEPLADFVRSASLTPYSLQSRRGELKYLIVTASPAGELMVRFVLRSKALLAKLQSRLPQLRDALPALRVASVNLHPGHQAVLEGDTEILLTDQGSLPMAVNDINLQVGPRSFFQTNSAVAAALYRQGAQWLSGRSPDVVWDLYCGVGGFALHAAQRGRSVHGIEISDDAISHARTSTNNHAGHGEVRFYVGDAYAATRELPAPDTVIVNPPRRGIGPELCAQIERSGPRTVLYSSCNATTLRRDLEGLPSYTAIEARLFDMFPQTNHAEVLVLLEQTSRD